MGDIDMHALRLTSITDITQAVSDLMLAPCTAERGERGWHLTCDGMHLRVSDVQAEEPRADVLCVAAFEALRAERGA
jgi:hypothetical protein